MKIELHCSKRNDKYLYLKKFNQFFKITALKRSVANIKISFYFLKGFVCVCN